MRYLACLGVLIAFAAAPVGAGTILYQGTFALDNQVQEFTFTVASTTTVTLETYGYGGGTVGSTTIPAGGFYPTIALFDPSPNYSNTVSCPSPGTADPVYGCYDAYLQQLVTPGTYTVALMVFDNAANGDLGSGFANDSNPGFTCAEAGGLSGSFCDLSGAGESRTGNWALAITGADSTLELGGQTPEPCAVSLAGIGLALAAFLSRRHVISNRRIG